MRIFVLMLCLCISRSAPAQQPISREAAFLGIQSESISKKKAKLLGFTNVYGSYITRTLPNTPAQAAGLMPFDYIYGIDKLTTRAEQSLSDMLAQYRSGDEAAVYFVRNGKVKKATITFTSQPGRMVELREKKAFLGVSPGPNEDEKNEKLGVVVKVVANSTAAAMGIENGDRIMAINGYPMVDWKDISSAIEMLAAGDLIEVQLDRDGRRKNLKDKVKSYDASRTQTEYTWTPKTEERAFLGISSNSVTEEKAATLGFENAYGSYITEIYPGTAAEKAGLQAFDYVYGIDQHRTGPETDLTELLKRYRAGDKAVIHFYRQGKPLSTEITLSSRSDVKNVVKDRCDKPFFGVSESYWRGESAGQGVPVDIVAGSTSEIMGMQNGDIILKVNGYPILDWSDISVAISNMKVGAEITVLYLRGNSERESTLPIKSLCDTKGKEASAWEFHFDWKDLPLGKRNDNTIVPAEGYEPVNMNSVISGITNLDATEAEDLKTRFNIQLSAANDLPLEDIQLLPNPGVGLFRLQFKLPETGVTELRIFNSAGRLIYAYELGVFSGEFTDDVDISQNGAGNYYLEVRQGERSATKKITLQN